MNRQLSDIVRLQGLVPVAVPIEDMSDDCRKQSRVRDVLNIVAAADREGRDGGPPLVVELRLSSYEAESVEERLEDTFGLSMRRRGDGARKGREAGRQGRTATGS